MLVGAGHVNRLPLGPYWASTIVRASVFSTHTGRARRVGITLHRASVRFNPASRMPHLGLQFGTAVTSLPAALTIFEVPAGRVVATMDLVMSQKKVLSSKTDMADMTHMVDMPRVVFAMSV